MRKNLKPFPSVNVDPVNFIDDYLQPIWDLPNLRQPPPTPAQPSSNCVALVILFTTEPYRRVENLQAWVRAAIYSRRSALCYTDAVSQNVDVKLYIEDALREMLTPTLEENFVDPDNDVIWFPAPPLEKTADGVYGYLGKQMSPYYDEQLLPFERILVWDADTFFLPRNHTLFRKISGFAPAEIGYIHAPNVYWETFQHTFISKLMKDTQKGGIPVDQLLRDAGVSLKDFPDLVAKPFGCLWTYSPAYYHQHRPEFVAWIKTHGPYFGNDELTAICWSNLFDIPIASLAKRLQLTINHTLKFLGNPDTETDLLHGFFTHENASKFSEYLHI